jgi:NADH dehydrogenase
VYTRENVEATRTLLDAAKNSGVSRVLHISTIAVTIHDTSNYPYAASKKTAEAIVQESGLRYTILRPTIVIGPQSPVLSGLYKLATAPFIPLFGGGTARIQPVDVEDLAGIMHGVVREDWFENQVVDVGGPSSLTMKELLTRIRIESGREAALSLPVPIWSVAPFLGLLEGFMLPLLPFTSGQLKAFASDGVASKHPYMEQWHGKMKSLEEMLRRAVPHAA